MKTKYWVILFAAVLLLCLGLSAGFLTGGETHSFAEISSGGSLVRTVDLRIDQTFTVETENGGYNVVTVEQGKIGVTEATCPDRYCMERGMVNSGAQVVCLPNRLVITLVGEPGDSGVDGVAG